jgi:hypothetical protein
MLSPISVDPRPALLQQRHQHVEPDQRRDHDRAVDHRIVLADQRLLRGLADDQQQHEIERRDLRERALAGETQQHQHEEVHERRADDGFHRDDSSIGDQG